VVADIYGEEAAKNIQLHMEYDPEPPFSSGSPRSASPNLVRAAREQLAPFVEKRRRATICAAENLRKHMSK